MSKLQDEIDEFHRAMNAKALVAAFVWADNDFAKLSAAAGLKKDASRMWLHRKKIPPAAALVLEAVEGFPLTAREMRSDIDWFRFKQRLRCNCCGRWINPPNYRRGYLSLLTDRVKAAGKSASTARRDLYPRPARPGRKVD